MTSKKFIIIITLFFSLHSFSQQLEYPKNNCGNLKKENESYAAGDKWNGWCLVEKPTSYTKCQCEFEKEVKRYNETLKKVEEQEEKLWKQNKNLEEKINEYNKKGYDISQTLFNESSLNFEADKHQAIAYYQNVVGSYNKMLSIQKDICNLRRRADANRECYDSKSILATIEEFKNKINQLQELNKKKVITINTDNSHLKNSDKNDEIVPQESIYEKRRKQAETRQTQKEIREQKQQDEANRIIENSKRQEEAFNRKISKAKSNIDNMISSWAKEEDFRRKVNSLTDINSVDASGIIKEARYKIEELNNLYSSKKKDAIRQVDNIYKTNTGNNTQNAVNGVFNVLGKVVSQSSLEKERKKKIEALENEKQKRLNKIAEKIKSKYQPVAESYLQKAKYAVIQDEENYYLKQYEYNKCMIDNSLSVVLGKESCSKPQIKSFTKKSIYTGKDYYNAFLRKGKSVKLIDKAEYFLELALEKEPSNYEWLKEKYKILDRFNLKDKIIILNKFTLLKPNNSEYKTKLKSLKAKFNLTKEVNAFKIEDLIKNRPNYNWDKHSGLMRYYENGKGYFINKNGEIVLRFEGYNFQYNFRNEYNQHLYDLGHDEYNEGLLRVANSAWKYGYLDTDLYEVIPLIYKRATKFNDGIAAVQNMDTGKWGFINKKGEVVIDFKFDRANYFSENLAFVRLASKKKGKQKSAYINVEGEIAFEGNFDSGGPFINGTAVVTKYGKGSFMGGSNTKSYHIDSEGRRLNKKNYAQAFPYNKSGTAIVGKRGWKGDVLWTIVDKSGSPIIDEKFQDMPIFTNGVAKVNIGSLTKRKNVLINEKGERINKKINSKSLTKNVSKAKTSKEVKNILLKHYDEVRETKDGFIVKLVDKVGFADLLGRIIIPVKLHTLGEFHEGLAVFKKVYKKCGYMNIKGEVVIKENYYSCGDFSEGLAAVVKVGTFSRKGGYINKEGKIVIPLIYYDNGPFVNGKAQVNAGNYNNPNIYFINKEGKKITE